MKFERVLKFRNFVGNIENRETEECGDIQRNHPRSYSRRKDYKEHLAKKERAYEVWKRLDRKLQAEAQRYVDGFKPNPLNINMAISDEEWKALPLCDRIIRRFAYDSHCHFSNVLEISDIVWAAHYKDMMLGLNKFGVKKLALLDTSSALMEALTFFLENGWKVEGIYHRELPKLNERALNYTFEYFDEAQGLLLVKE